MMKLNTTSYWIIALCFITISIQAQTNCEYTLRLFDEFGDSWNGAALTLDVNEDISVFSMAIEDGAEVSFPLIFATGDVIQLEFTSGRFDNEISYQLLDPNGAVAFEDGPTPTMGAVFSDTITCPACSPVALSGIIIDDIRDFTAELSWLQSNESNTYWVQYGLEGFDPASDTVAYTAVNTTRNSIAFDNLLEKRTYDVYISSLCEGDTSLVVGPINFQTVYTNDVGIIDILTPVTGCEIGDIDSVEVVLKNFGAKPQSLIPFNFVNNGVPGGVNQPFDGVFTGVLGRDSTFTITFDTKADIREPNIYEIVAFNELENDSDMTNDTFKIELINIPNIMEYPYFTDFEDWTGGWRPDEQSRNSSWEFGEPLLNGAASGNNAWTTSLLDDYNNNESSYLVSPCLDFTSLNEDPIIYFNLFVETESCCDEAWVEVSTNAGDTWSKVQAGARSLNWYNDVANEWWDGDGEINTWTPVSSLLAGTAGEAEVLVRIAFSSDFSASDNGIGIDNIFISEPLMNDMASISVDHTSLEECGEDGDEVILEMVNLGEVEQRGFLVFYQIGDGPVVSEQINTPIGPLETLRYTFEETFNSSDFGTYEIKAWTEGLNDEFMLNDTARIEFATLRSIPFAETFDRSNSMLPEGWDTPDEPNPITIGHGAPSFVLSDNLWEFDNYFEANSPVFGFVEENDSLTFEYRYVNFGAPGDALARTLEAGDSLIVSLSTDCGLSYVPVFRADTSNHVASEAMQQITIRLTDFIGEAIKIRFQAYREENANAGDYYIDIDNVNVVRCSPSLDLSVAVENLSRPDLGDGRITVDAASGLAPYSYAWSNGQVSKGIFGLEAGTYTVTVTDAVGCSDVISATVSSVTAVQDVAALQSVQLVPNPTAGNAQLKLQLLERTDVKVLLFNAVGQLIREFPTQAAAQQNYTLDLNSYANGLYFVQIWANGQAHTERLVLLRE